MSMDRGVYAPPMHGDLDPRTDEVSEEPRRGLLLLAVSAMVLFALAGVAWSTYNQGIRDAGAPPRIKAPDDPYKTAPADPGGAAAEHQDVRVYDLLEGEAARAEAAPAEAAPAVEPANVVTLSGEGGDGRSFGEPAEPEAVPGRGPVTIADADERSAWSETGEPRAGLEPEDAPEPQALAAVRAPSPRIKPEHEAPAHAAPVRPAAPPAQRAAAAPAPAKARPAPAAGGAILLQIGSYKSDAAAHRGWDRLVRDYGDVLAGREPRFVRADLGQYGTWYRIHLAFESNAEAAELCNAFMARAAERGEKCFIVH